MEVNIRREDAEIVRDLLQQKIEELDKEINRTESRAFKRELQEIDRAIGRVVTVLSGALAVPEPTPSVSVSE
jgi:hypothetical protein